MKTGFILGSMLIAAITFAPVQGIGGAISDWWGNDWIERPSEEYTHLVLVNGKNYSEPTMQVFENVKGFDWDFCHDDIELFRSGEDTPFAVIENVRNHRWMLASEVAADPVLSKFVLKLRTTPEPKEETGVGDK